MEDISLPKITSKQKFPPRNSIKTRLVDKDGVELPDDDDDSSMKKKNKDKAPEHIPGTSGGAVHYFPLAYPHLQAIFRFRDSFQIPC